MTTPTITTSNSHMHIDIMATGSRERPPMLATRRYTQWKSRFFIYVDTKPNKKELRQCIFDVLYVMTEITVLAIPTTTTKEAITEHNVPETYKNTTPENQGESLNKQDVKTNLFWEFGKFTSRDGESIESYYSRFYKMINEMIRKKLEVATIQVNECKSLILVVATQQYPDTHYQAPKPHKTYAPSSKPTPSTRSYAPTRNRSKETDKPITPLYESAFKEDEDNDPE
ncbi:hypothetical protein Tco_1344890 [Tanacetum coccineum]